VLHGEPEAGLTARAGHRPGPERARRVGGAWILTPAWHRHRGRRGGLCQRPAAGAVGRPGRARGRNWPGSRRCRRCSSPSGNKHRLPAGPARLRCTRCADVSGADPATASTAAGPCPGRAR